MRFKGRILYKLGGVILLLLTIHFIIVIIGLYTSKRLSGDAAEINYAGSVRMRSFKIGFLLSRIKDVSEEDSYKLKKEVDEEKQIINEVLYGLRDGNSKYGLPGERDIKISRQLNMIIKEWEEVITPLLKRIMDTTDLDEAGVLIGEYNDKVVDYVSSVNKVVRLFEVDSEEKVAFLNRTEYLLLLPAITVSAFALIMIFLLIERPIASFISSMKKVKEGSLDARIKIRSSDEFAFMAEAFNSMTSELEKSHQALEALAITDSLTSLLNHKSFHECLDEEFKRIARRPEPISLLMIDIDDFKMTNDTYGHLAGDLVLKKVADILIKMTREIDVVARYGGDEFIVLLLNTDNRQAIRMAERIRMAVEKTEFEFDGKRIPVTLSLGIATAPIDAGTNEKLIELTDKALYHAKSRGRNQAWHYRDIT